MTKLIVCSVRDRATEAFSRPFYVSRPAEAIRSFSVEVQRKPQPGEQNNLNAHPTDYELFQLGIWDDESGNFENYIERLARAEDFRQE